MNTPKTFYLATPAGIEKLEKMKQDDATDESTPMRGFITKYALTQGVFEKQGTVPDLFPQHFIVSEAGHTTVYRGVEWWESEFQAMTRAIHMARNAISAREKQIQRLEGLANDFQSRINELSKTQGSES